MVRRLFFIFTFLIVLPVYAHAAEKIGTIVEIEGSVSGEGGTYNIDDPIHLNDTIKTGPESKALILLVDDTEITLSENASFLVDKYIYDPDDTSETAAEFKVLDGAFLFVSGLISKSDSHDINIETSIGSIGIRGTTVWGGTLGDEYGVLVQDGEVTVTNNAGRVRVTTNQGTFMKSIEDKPRTPKAWGQKKIDRAVHTIDLKRKAKIKQRIAHHKTQNIKRRAQRIEMLENRRDKRLKLMGEHIGKRQELRDQRQKDIKDRRMKRRLNP